MNYQNNIYIYGFLLVVLLLTILLGIFINLDARKNPSNNEKASRYNKKLLLLAVGSVAAFAYTFFTGQY